MGSSCRRVVIPRQRTWSAKRGIFSGESSGPSTLTLQDSTYNLGCIAAREGERDEAFSLLAEAVDHGLSPSDDLGIENDSDLKLLHGDPRFDVLVTHAKERAAAAAKKQP